jgi:hypothetical protein
MKARIFKAGFVAIVILSDAKDLTSSASRCKHQLRSFEFDFVEPSG